MDTSDSMITFDEKGVCDHCRVFYSTILPNWHTDERGRQALSKIVEKIKKEHPWVFADTNAWAGDFREEMIRQQLSRTLKSMKESKK